MKHIGLFEGIGGFSLAARWMGWDTIAWCEWNEFGQKVLRHHFPEAEGHGDITKTNFTKYNGTIDIITGGFPCQPYSAAGKRKGKSDDRHLWPEMLRTIREVQPKWIVGENVPGLVNWERGMVLSEIKTDLENEGFEVLPPLIIPACAKGFEHRRDRVWIIAHSNKIGLSDTPEIRELGRRGFGFDNQRDEPDVLDIKSAVRGKDDGVPRKLDEHRLMALGNAIVPQVALQIFKAIESSLLANSEINP